MNAYLYKKIIIITKNNYLKLKKNLRIINKLRIKSIVARCFFLIIIQIYVLDQHTSIIKY